MSDDKKHDANQQNTHGADSGHNKDQKHGSVKDAAITKFTTETTKISTEVLLHPVEKQVIRVTVPEAIKLAEKINLFLESLPREAADGFGKAIEHGKVAKGLLKYAHGTGTVAVTAIAGLVEFTVATNVLNEDKNTAKSDAITGALVMGGATLAGVSTLPASALALIATEIAREGLIAAGYDVHPSHIRQIIESSRAEYPERLKDELSINEAKAALRNPNSEQYKAMAEQYKQDYAKLSEQYGNHRPLGMPSTAEHYVDARLAAVNRGLDLVSGDAPSGIKRMGKDAPTKDKRAEATLFEDVPFTSPQAAAQEPAKQPEAIAVTAPTPVQTAPAPAAMVSMAPVVEAPRAEASPQNDKFAALLAGYDFKAAVGCKVASMDGVCVPTQQRDQQAQVAVAGR